MKLACAESCQQSLSGFKQKKQKQNKTSASPFSSHLKVKVSTLIPVATRRPRLAALQGAFVDSRCCWVATTSFGCWILRLTEKRFLPRATQPPCQVSLMDKKTDSWLSQVALFGTDYQTGCDAHVWWGENLPKCLKTAPPGAIKDFLVLPTRLHSQSVSVMWSHRAAQ